MTNQAAPHKQLVVVGVDGSSSSVEALAWAARYAVAVGARIVAVGAWHLPANADWAVVPDLDLKKDAETEVNRVIDLIRVDYPDVEIETSILNEYPAPALLDVAKDADLLVVGSRGHGAFAGMLLGSVSTHVLHHATCPVVVVRHPAP